MANLNFEIKILDENLTKIGFWKFNSKELVKFLRIINNKYGLGFIIKQDKRDNKDIDWAR